MPLPREDREGREAGRLADPDRREDEDRRRPERRRDHSRDYHPDRGSRSARERGDRERGDRERGDRERGDRGDRGGRSERDRRDRGDRGDRGDRERGDRGDRERGDRGDRDRADRGNRMRSRSRSPRRRRRSETGPRHPGLNVWHESDPLDVIKVGNRSLMQKTAGYISHSLRKDAGKRLRVLPLFPLEASALEMKRSRDQAMVQSIKAMAKAVQYLEQDRIAMRCFTQLHQRSNPLSAICFVLERSASPLPLLEDLVQEPGRLQRREEDKQAGSALDEQDSKQSGPSGDDNDADSVSQVQEKEMEQEDREQGDEEEEEENRQTGSSSSHSSQELGEGSRKVTLNSPEALIMQVNARSRDGDVAGAICFRIRRGFPVGVQASGPFSVINCIMAIERARHFLSQDNIDLYFFPSFYRRTGGAHHHQQHHQQQQPSRFNMGYDRDKAIVFNLSADPEQVQRYQTANPDLWTGTANQSRPREDGVRKATRDEEDPQNDQQNNQDQNQDQNRSPSSSAAAVAMTDDGADADAEEDGAVAMVLPEDEDDLVPEDEEREHGLFGDEEED